MSPELNDETVGVQTAFKCGSKSAVAGIPCKHLRLERMFSRRHLEVFFLFTRGGKFLPIAPPMIQAEPNIFPWSKSFGENYQIEACCLSPSLHPVQDFI